MSTKITKKSRAAEDYTGREFIITREFAAPRELVFQAWTDPKHLAGWWGPHGFTNPVCEWDARPGRRIHVVMRGPNGVDYPMGGEFREIVAPKRLVFTSGALDGKGKFLFEFLHTVTFVERKGRTTVTVASRVLMTTAEANKYIGGFEAGMTQSLEKLTAHLAQQSGPLIIERTFAAPAARIWRALTNRDDMERWYFELKEFQPVVSFEFQFTVEHEGFTYVHHCRVAEVIPGKKLAYSWRYEGQKGDSLVTFELFPEGNGTRLKLTHTGLESFPKTPAYARRNFQGGWTQLIGSSLKEFVENATSDRDILISRVVDAPRELVWQAMTDPRHVVHWWGPRGFTTTIEEMDVRPGGVWKHVMHGPDGADYPNKSIFKEVVPPGCLVFSHGGGKKGSPGATFVATWTFETVEDGKTKVTIHMVFPSAADRDTVVKVYGAIEGGKQTLARLSEHLPAMSQPFIISRVFDAPRELVWKAFTDPKRMKQWWGPKGFKVLVSKMDLRPGGTYLYGMQSPDGHDMWGKFVYREITPPERLVLINSFSDEKGGVTRHPMSPTWPLEMLSIFTFTEHEGKTTFTVQWTPHNATETEIKTFNEKRPSMNGGWSGTMDQLGEYLAKAVATGTK